jgi:hypothetical protein
VRVRDGLQLGGLLLRRGVVEEVASPDLRTAQILEQARLAQRRMDLDVEVEPVVCRAVGRRLVQHHHVRERHPPQVVHPHERTPQHVGEIVQLRGGQVGQARVRLARRDVRLVRIAREVGHERQRAPALHEEPPSVLLLGVDHVAEQWTPVLREVLRGRVDLRLDRAEDEVGGVDLRVGMRVAHADDFSLVLERQHVAHLRPVAELDVLLAERLEQAHDFRVRQLGEGEIVAWCVAHHARHAVGATGPMDRWRGLELGG